MRNEAIHHFCQTLPGQINQAQGLSSNRSALNSLSGSYSDLLAPKMHRGAQATPSHNNLIVTKKTMIIGIIKYNFSVYQGQTCLGVICTRTNISTTGNFQWFNNRAGADGGNILFLYPKLYKTRCFLIALPFHVQAEGMGFPSECWDFPGAVHGVPMVCITLVWPQLLPVLPSSSIMVFVLPAAECCPQLCSQTLQLQSTQSCGPQAAPVVKILLSVPQIRSWFERSGLF